MSYEHDEIEAWCKTWDVPTARKMSEWIRWFLTLPGNGSGGSLHIVLEDLNVKKSHVQFCHGWAAGQGDVEAMRLALLLLRQSKTQRLKAIQLAHAGG